MATAGQPTSLVAETAQAVAIVPAVRVVPEDPVVPAVRVALVVPEDRVVLVALVVLESPVVRVALVVLESPVARVVLVVPEDRVEPVALVVPENPVVPVALELQTVPVVVRVQVIVRVAGELQHDQVAVVVVRDHLRVRLAVPLKTKSVTTPHRPDLVPLLAEEEDLAAAVAETTREPVAAEAAIAWAAAE